MRTNLTFKGKVYQSGKVMKRVDSRGRTIVRMNFVHFDNYRDSNGEQHNRPHFVSTVAFGAIADSLLSRIKSGSYTEIEGAVRTSVYNEKTQIDLIMTQFDLLNDKSQDPLVFFTDTTTSSSTPPVSVPAPAGQMDFDDDIPF